MTLRGFVPKSTEASTYVTRQSGLSSVLCLMQSVRWPQWLLGIEMDHSRGRSVLAYMCLCTGFLCLVFLLALTIMCNKIPLSVISRDILGCTTSGRCIVSFLCRTALALGLVCGLFIYVVVLAKMIFAVQEMRSGFSSSSSVLTFHSSGALPCLLFAKW